jgi:hypothetical protein
MKHVRTLGIITLLVVSVVLPLHTGYTQEKPPEPIRTANVQPKVGSFDTTFAFYATGFYDEEVVDVWLNTPYHVSREVEVDELYEASGTGRLDWYWEPPADAAPGSWQMVAQGRTSGVIRVIDFEIRADGMDYIPPDTEDVKAYNVHPKSGPPGTEFAFYAAGFDADESDDDAKEKVKLWLETPNWQQIDLGGEHLFVAPPSGRVDWAWTAPPDAQPGTWHMVILGRESDLKFVIPFEIVR